MPIIISLNEDGTIHGELNTSVNQLSAIIRQAIAKGPVGENNPKINIEFGIKKITTEGDESTEEN